MSTSESTGEDRRSALRSDPIYRRATFERAVVEAMVRSRSVVVSDFEVREVLQEWAMETPERFKEFLREWNPATEDWYKEFVVVGTGSFRDDLLTVPELANEIRDVVKLIDESIADVAGDDDELAWELWEAARKVINAIAVHRYLDKLAYKLLVYRGDASVDHFF